jgi:hypothetical protein
MASMYVTHVIGRRRQFRISLNVLELEYTTVGEIEGKKRY